MVVNNETNKIKDTVDRHVYVLSCIKWNQRCLFLQYVYIVVDLVQHVQSIYNNTVVAKILEFQNYLVVFWYTVRYVNKLRSFEIKPEKYWSSWSRPQFLVTISQCIDINGVLRNQSIRKEVKFTDSITNNIGFSSFVCSSILVECTIFILHFIFYNSLVFSFLEVILGYIGWAAKLNEC